MARKKHHAKKRTTHRRRRISGLGSGIGHDAMEAVGLVVGSIAATVIQRQATSLSPKIVGGIELVGGIMLKRHAKSPFMAGMGWGIMGAGAIHVAHDFGMISGVEDFVSGIAGGMGYTEERYVNGLSNESHMSGYDAMGGLANGAYVSGSEPVDYLNEM